MNKHRETVFDFESLKAYENPKEYREHASRCKRTLKGFAERLHLYCDGGIVFEGDSGMGYIWNGKYWESAGHKNVYIDLICEIVRDQIIIEAEEAEGKAEKEGYEKWIGRIDNVGSYYSDVIKKLKAMRGVTIPRLPSQPYLLNATNGIIDLRTGKTIPHDKSYFMLGITGIPFDYNAKLKDKTPQQVWHALVEHAPMTAKFLYQTFHVKTNTDAENQQRMVYVLALLGHLLNGSAETQKFYFIKGKGGNGKGTLDRLMIKIMGPYARTADPAMFTTAGQKEYKRQTADFIGIRFVAIPEISKKSRLNAALVKNWSGGDEISFMRLYESEGKFLPESTLVFSLNHVLHLDEYGPAMKRRFVLLKTENTAKSLPGGEIKGYENLLIEKEGTVLGSILLRMSMSLLNGEVTEPACVMTDSTDYVIADDFVAEFVNNCISVVPYTEPDEEVSTINSYMTFTDLYGYAKRYNAVYGSGVHGRFMNRQAFAQAIEDVEAIPEEVNREEAERLYGHLHDESALYGFLPGLKLSDEGYRLLYKDSTPDAIAKRVKASDYAQQAWLGAAPGAYQNHPGYDSE